MKISQSNFNLQSPDSNLVRSYLIATVQKKYSFEKYFTQLYYFKLHTLKEEPLDCLDLTLGKDTLQIFHTSIGAKHLCSTLFAKNHDSYTQVILMPSL